MRKKIENDILQIKRVYLISYFRQFFKFRERDRYLVIGDIKMLNSYDMKVFLYMM